MKIAILGYGTVGSGVYEILQKKNLAKSISVKKIWSRPKKNINIPNFCPDIDDIINDKEIELVVEVLGGIDVPFDLISRMLKSKKHVVTANKAVIARHYDALTDLAKENGVSLNFEASVGGGIPWIKNVELASRIDSISKCYGVLNGTSNFILDTMLKEDQDFGDVLKEAQDLGYAESDPSADIDGFDVLNKLIISARKAFNKKLDPDDFFVHSMRQITKNDIHYFKQKGHILKYIGEITHDEGVISLHAVPETFVEATIPSNNNIASLEGKTIGTLKFYGQGAGKLPTANAVVQDILDISKNMSYLGTDNDGNSVIIDTKKNHYTFVIRTNESVDANLIKETDGDYLITHPITLSDIKKQTQLNDSLIVRVITQEDWHD
ncbi:homoserine dehydrogenase [Melissococcus sp. OM08-11BH]|uniref:homoserine dehydrogenase n=1 Tax=Melissococcus sp. OM08-11BH TaxID=2293110 RepID=UPI000E46DAAC|nr:homoserine dehydrogenase [Melissococcus sp. OM08-11BH]RGI31808.1 homoserine dehydrogenase [Melissococcus sp. OM08-11BH]